MPLSTKDLRVQDLIAKIAGVHLTATVKVLRSLDLIAASMDQEETEFFESNPDILNIDRPTTNNINAVFRATGEINGYLIRQGIGVDYLDEIKATKAATSTSTTPNSKWKNRSRVKGR